MKYMAFMAVAGIALSASASATQISPKICAIGYDKRDFVVDVPTTSDTALMFTTIDKPCEGPVLVRLTVTTSVQKGSSVKVTLRARCSRTNGYANACAVGQLIYPLGNEAILSANVGPKWETHSYEFIIEHQKPGRWKYELMLDPDNSAATGKVGARTMVVEAHPDL